MCGPPDENFDWHEKRVCQHCEKIIEFQDGKYLTKFSQNYWIKGDEQKFVCKTHSYAEVFKEEKSTEVSP